VTAPLTPRSRPRLPHDRRVLLLALSAGLPAVIASLVLLIIGDYAPKTLWTFGGLVAGIWLVVALVLRERVVRPLQTLSNMLAALREGDFSLRARQGDLDDALGLALLEINMLGDTLRSQRLGALEATSLLRAVMSEIDVAIFAFDDKGVLRLSNRAGARLLGQPAERLAGRSAQSLGLEALLEGLTLRVIDRAFPERGGRWEVRRTTFRQDGLPHQLLVVTDVTKSLREEELQAWQRLVRVLSHEINNSLAPIKSLAGTLREVTDRAMVGSSDAEDVNRGLGIIATRAESLSRFMSAYARLARLPAPRFSSVEVLALVRRVAGLETRCTVTVREGPETIIRADRDQLEQALINLVRNAADASIPLGGAVEVAWLVEQSFVEFQVIDGGPGLSGTANLFVPFYTTKPDGSGIGLVLSRQIAEAHGGWLALENRTDGCPGAIARLRISTE
jgi:PAS domain S-box-containing protein